MEAENPENLSFSRSSFFTDSFKGSVFCKVFAIFVAVPPHMEHRPNIGMVLQSNADSHGVESLMGSVETEVDELESVSIEIDQIWLFDDFGHLVDDFEISIWFCTCELVHIVFF